MLVSLIFIGVLFPIQVQTIYVTHVSECGISRGCWRLPIGCKDSSDCQTIVTWKHERRQLVVEVETKLANAGQWIGVGFSKDQKMASELLIRDGYTEVRDGKVICGGELILDNIHLDSTERNLMHVISSGRYNLFFAYGDLKSGEKKMHSMAGQGAPWKSKDQVRFCQRCSGSFANLDAEKDF